MNMYPDIYNISAKEDFFKKLTFGIVGGFLKKSNSKKLVIILPTKISCQILQKQFKEAGFGYIKTYSINEIEQNNNGIARITQISKISEIIFNMNIAKYKNLANVICLAEYFASLIQKLELYEIDFSKVIKLIDEDLANHQQEIFSILKEVLNIWKKNGFITKAGANSKAMYKLDGDNIIIAGITQDIPSIIHLMNKAKLVVFQGIDNNLKSEDWQNINFTHPQYSYKKIIDKLGRKIEDVKNFDNQQICSFLSNALRAAKLCDNWHKNKQKPSNIKYLKCYDLHSEAKSIVNILKNSHYTSAMVVTQDDSLIVKIIANLKLANIQANIIRDYPLKNSNLGALFQLTLNLINENFSLVSSLAFLKHQLVDINKKIITEIEMIIRDKKFYGIDIFDIIFEDEKLSNIIEACKILKENFAPKLEKLQNLLKHHISFIEKVTLDPWSGEDCEQLKIYLEQIIENSENFAQIYTKNYQQIFNLYIKSAYYRPESIENKIIISKPIDVRLQSADLVILAGLNEGIWPAKISIDPCLNRYLIKKIGLPEFENQIGEEARDFQLLAQNKEVILSRAEKIEGVFTNPSRWLSRVLTFSNGIEIIEPSYDSFIQEIKRKDKNIPLVPLNYRPNQLSVTQIDKLVFNPYHIYVDMILNLKTLPPINKEVSMLDFGIFVHKALEIYHYNHKEPNLDKLIEAGNSAIFKLNLDKAKLQAIYWQRFLRIAKWFVANEASKNQIFLEVYGKILINDSFTLVAKADRLEYLPDDSLIIIDYKTGSLPSNKSITSGKNLQLLLEGLIARRGGYNYQKHPKKIHSICYIQLSGGEKPAELLEVNLELIDKAEAYLMQLINFYQDPNSQYLYTKKKKLGYCEYEHLARSII